MAGVLVGFLSWTENRGLVVGGACALLLTGLVLRILLRKPPSPEELERKRRVAIQGSGKLGDAEIFEIRDQILHYSYAVGGVTYTASQDVSTLRPMLPEDLSALIGSASLKYDPRNPANSIVVAEEWSGLRPAPR